MKFEEQMQQLSALVAKLEAGGLSLEESIRLYGEGVTLAANCKAELDAAKLTVTEYDKQNAESDDAASDPS